MTLSGLALLFNGVVPGLNGGQLASIVHELIGLEGRLLSLFWS